MKSSIPLSILLVFLLAGNVNAQSFPNPVKLSTGLGTSGTLDTLWQVSPHYVYTATPPNPIGLQYTPAFIAGNYCAGTWINPTSFPSNMQGAHWITSPDFLCENNSPMGYWYFRLTLNVPTDCNGHSVTVADNYVLNLWGFVDNTIKDVFVNGISSGIHGGGFVLGSQLNINLSGPWQAGLNYVDVLLYNDVGSGRNPYGLLLVANFADTVTTCKPAITGNLTICKGTSATLKVTNPAKTYLWSTGSFDSSITVSPDTTTSYHVTVTYANSTIDTFTTTVTVNPLPMATVAIDTAHCIGDSVTLKATGGTSYLWSPTTNLSAPDSAVTVARNLSANTATTYKVQITNSFGCKVTDSITVSMLAPANVHVGPDTTLCFNSISGTDTVYLYATGGTAYQWHYAGISVANSPNPFAVFTSAGTYQVGLSIFGNTGCSLRDTVTILVNPAPNVTIQTDKNIMCARDSAQVCTTHSFKSYLWNTEGTKQCTTAKEAGDYWVMVTDNNSCSAISSHVPVAVYPVTPVMITQLGDTLTSFNATSYQWYLNDVIMTGATDSVYIAKQTGNYSVQITDTNGCTERSNNKTVSVTGIQDIENIYVSIYPNPSNGNWYLTVSSELVGSALQVFDVEGRLVLKSEINNPKSEINLNVPAGVYWLRIYTDSGTVARKLVKL